MSSSPYSCPIALLLAIEATRSFGDAWRVVKCLTPCLTPAFKHTNPAL